MCNLKKLASPTKEVADLFGALDKSSNAGPGEVYPGQIGLVVTQQGAARTLEPMTWGFGGVAPPRYLTLLADGPLPAMSSPTDQAYCQVGQICRGCTDEAQSLHEDCKLTHFPANRSRRLQATAVGPGRYAVLCERLYRYDARVGSRFGQCRGTVIALVRLPRFGSGAKKTSNAHRLTEC